MSPLIFFILLSCLCALYGDATVKHFLNYLNIVKTEFRSRLNERNIECLQRIKVEGLDLKEFAEKCVLMQSYYGGIQKNNVLLNENIKTTITIKQNKSKRDSLTLILMNTWVV